MKTNKAETTTEPCYACGKKSEFKDIVDGNIVSVCKACIKPSLPVTEKPVV